MNRTTVDRHRTAGERGYAAVLTALILVPLLGFAGFAVDVGAWYARASSIQAATDAAALAGVVWQPNITAAETAAREAAARNGFVHGVDGVQVLVSDAGNRELEVEIIDTDADLFFSSLFLDNVTIARTAVAEYIQEVPMGSPDNFLGNDPVAGASPNFWLATFGPGSSKRSGDRYHTEVCGGAIFCSGSTNDEHTPQGYTFTVEVGALQAAPLNFQIFDAVHHNYGDRCTEGSSNSGNGGDWLFADGDVGSEAWFTGNQKGLGTYPQERYEVGGAGNPGGAAWCPGDNGLDGTNYEMTVLVRSPDTTPFDAYDNPVVCYTRWGNDQPSDQAEFVSDLLDDSGRQPVASAAAGSGSVPGPSSVAFRDYFREWVDVCTVNTPQVGDYIVQVRTNASTADPTLWDTSVATHGRNRYSMRAGFGASTSPSFATGISFAADGRLPIFVNVPPGAPTSCGGIPTCFYIARVPPEYAGQQLQLDVFDLTDGSSLDITFVPPPDSGLGTFSSCDFIFFNENGSTTDLVDSNCTASHTSNSQLSSGGSNGDSIAAVIDIPASYSCNESSPLGCWVTVQMNFTGTPSDTTTWSAEVTGDPIRLIE